MAAGLFTPIALGDLELPNRIVMAPLTRNRAGQPGNVPQPINATYYAQRSSAGLIITEGSPISEMAHGYPGTPGIHSAAQMAGWKRVTDTVHAKGGRIVLQLWHVGRVSHPLLLPNGALPVAPSSIKPAGKAFTHRGRTAFVAPRALETSEMPMLIESFRVAARNAKSAGFDGVEVHGANGYLLDQFLRDGSNHRTDKYGGSIANRTRLLEEVVSAVCDVWGAGRVGVRVSPVNQYNDMRDSDPQALFNGVADALRPFGLAYLHVMERDVHGSEVPFDFDEVRGALRWALHREWRLRQETGQRGNRGGSRRLRRVWQTVHRESRSGRTVCLRCAAQSGGPSTFYGGREQRLYRLPALTGNDVPAPAIASGCLRGDSCLASLS